MEGANGLGRDASDSASATTVILYPSRRAHVFEYQVMDGSQAVVKNV